MRIKGKVFGAIVWTALVCALVASTFAQAEPNLALGKPVIASGPVWTGFTAANLTDGNTATIAHPLNSTGTLGYYFEIDLGATYQLNRILIHNRGDGCCPERLSDYDVNLYADAGGDSGALRWSARIRADGSNSGNAGIDTVTAALNPTQTFSGRFIRIINQNGAAYSPQVAEVEVYGAPAPQIVAFDAEPDLITNGQSTTLTWQITGATGATISPQIGALPAGSGSITVQPNSTTTYTLTSTNAAGASTATVRVGVDVVLQPPQITEFMADNSALKDIDGDYSDWIEIYNPNDYKLPLAGYFLSDSASKPTQWPFPNVKISARGYLIVFASAKNRAIVGEELHTNFKLDANGDYLSLANVSGVIQQFPATYPSPRTFPSQYRNISYGLGTNNLTGYFRPSTPGDPNGAAFAGVVQDLLFSLPRGFYDTNISLGIYSPTPGATIRYTKDFSEPTATTGLVYSGPIAISQSTVIRASAFRDGWSPATPVTHSYIYLSNVIAAPNMNTAITKNSAYAPLIRAGLLDVPSIAITTKSAINGDAEVKMAFEWLNPDNSPGIQVDAGVRNYGGAFTDFAKDSYRVYFRSDYGAAKLKYPAFAGFDHSIAPVDEFDALELRSGSHDMEQRGFYMSNIFTDDTLLDMGQLNPHGRFVHLYLNGAYWGLFHLRERWGAGMHQSYLGGAKTNYESINGNWNVGGWADPGSPYDGDGSVWEHIKQLRGDYEQVKPLLDVTQYADYMLMWMFGGAEDEYRGVGPNVPGSGFKFYLNDADGWFCVPTYCASGDRTARGAPGRLAGDGPGSIFSMLFKQGHPDYLTLLGDRIQRAFFNDGALTPAQNRARLLARCNEIQRAFIAESARWNYLTPTEWANRRDYVLNNWIPQRTTGALNTYSAAGFLPSTKAPALNQQGGIVPSGFRVQFSADNSATIYFTTNGADPRLPGGGVSPGAVIAQSGGATETLVSTGARWRYYTDATGLGSSAITNGAAGWSTSNWKHPSFNDSAWAEGPAQFGYGEGDEATVIAFGSDANNKWVSSYYRRAFSVANKSSITNLLLRLKRDDGAIVYINGFEVCRSSITTGPVNATTFADPASDDGQNFNEFNIPISPLVEGANEIAVEIHQATGNSSDVSFDLALLAARSDSSSAAGAPTLFQNTVIKTRAKIGTNWSPLNEAFFQVAASPVTNGDLVISEINFLPANHQKSEYLQIRNVGPGAVNLRGLRFVQGIDFQFPTNRETLLAPRQGLLLVKDLFRFQQRYGIDVPVAG
ncbi:MAG TPA: lamin tail domain-containing protein, partial [Verrucomicrobiae bacterium]